MKNTVRVVDVARAAGVSTATVSYAINRPDRVSKKTLTAVRDAINRLGYVPNEAARQLRTGRNTMIGLIVGDTRNPFFADVAFGAERVAEAAGYLVTVGNSGEHADRESRYVEAFERQGFQGILTCVGARDLQHLKDARQRGMPFILLDSNGSHADSCSVTIDDVRGGLIAATHLISTGRRRLVFAGGPDDAQQFRDRLAGARKACAGTDATVEIRHTAEPTTSAGAAIGREIAESGQYDGVLCTNDMVALGVLAGIQSAGRSVPDDIAVVGYDDITFAASASVPLTTIQQSGVVIGETGIRLLFDEIAEGPSHLHKEVVLQPRLVVRRSTDPSAR